jgi:hypothetical protein
VKLISGRDDPQRAGSRFGCLSVAADGAAAALVVRFA